MNIVVIGANGFVGPHLIQTLSSTYPDARITGTYLEGTKIENLSDTGAVLEELDICDTDRMRSFIEQSRPTHLINLAAQSSVGYSWINPVLTFRVNVIGTLNILQGIHDTVQKTRVLIIGSSEEYQSSHKRISESETIKPVNPYGLSKTTQEALGHLYIEKYDLPIVMTRSFNHTGPGQSETFVIPDWCRQIIRIERGEIPPEISVGNLNVSRDFSHVQDIVRDYVLLLDKGEPGEVYNVGSGRTYSLEDILERLIRLSGINIQIVVDPSKFRPSDNEFISCDRTKISCLGKTVYRSIDETLADTLEYWRSQMNKEDV